MRTLVFPGQGAQTVGMGKAVFEKYREKAEAAEEILQFPLRKLCLQNDGQLLNRTEYTQPALFVVNALSYYEYIDEGGCKPEYMMGNSLGEYNALLASGAFDFETGVKIVKERGRLMSYGRQGSMAAVLGLDCEYVKSIIDSCSKDVFVTNINAPTQIIIGGNKNEINDLKEVFLQNGARQYVVLNVSGAFHSPYMSECAVKFEKYMASIPISTQWNSVVVSNLTAVPYEKNLIKETMIKSLFSPVLFYKSIKYCLESGCNEFMQIGHGNSINSILNSIKRYEKDADFSVIVNRNQKAL